MEQITVRIPEDTLEDIGQEASEHGDTRSEISEVSYPESVEQLGGGRRLLLESETLGPFLGKNW
ncbi:hypothetical protein [Haladaptatus halobius]|uniref:hypothetical protein n=1 Tax=Haladaptatus halobius TaxID=2884875 RepID=UPI001D0B948D|nr:hypothetical protein [Haladaptatus halobius]